MTGLAEGRGAMTIHAASLPPGSRAARSPLPAVHQPIHQDRPVEEQQNHQDKPNGHHDLEPGGITPAAPGRSS